ncbi:hypothetical protein IAU59_004296 [Kwoniella sp. CBS 9459]
MGDLMLLQLDTKVEIEGEDEFDSIVMPASPPTESKKNVPAAQSSSSPTEQTKTPVKKRARPTAPGHSDDMRTAGKNPTARKADPITTPLKKEKGGWTMDDGEEEDRY